MFWVIVRKEILDSLMSSRFGLTVILCLTMTILSFYVLLSDYNHRLEEYDSCVRKQGGPVSMNAIYRKPEVLSIFGQELDRKLGTMIETRGYGISYVTFVGATGSYAGRKSHYLESFASIDFAFVIKAIFSLLAIFLSYHLISGENEAGTLRLNLSNPVTRSAILFGKFCGGIVLLIISLTISFLIGLIILLLSPIIQFGNEEWIRIGMIYLTSILYLVCFFSIGILASSLTKTSAVSLIIGIVTWVCLVFIIPNLTTTLATEIQPIPTKYEMEEKVNSLTNALTKHLDSFFKAGFNAALGREIGSASGKAEDFFNDYTNTLYNQATLAQRLSEISPASAFDYAADQFARTDAGTYRNMLRRVREYTDEYGKSLEFLFGGKQEDHVRIMKKADASFDMSQPLDKSLSLAMPNILILFLFDVILLLVAYFAFLRYGVKE